MARPIVGLVSLLILAGGIVLQFFVILSGGVKSYPIDLVYFLQADTGSNGYNGGGSTRWTYFALCGVDQSTGRNANCGKARAAIPFDPPRNFGSDAGVPEEFLGTRKFYLLSRFAFAFFLIALFLAVCAFFSGLLAVCSRLGGYVAGMVTFFALAFQTLAAALATAWIVQGRNIFNANGQTATIGVKAMGFIWGAMGCFLVAMAMFCSSGKKKEKVRTRRSFFGRRRHRRSFMDSESQRRVKHDY